MRSIDSGEVSDEALFRGSLLESRRNLIRALYFEGGEVSDKSGRATAKLIKKAGIGISMTSASSLLNAMDNAGWIERKLNAKRTYSIILNPENTVVSRLIGFFDSENQPEVIIEDPQQESNDTSITDAAAIADELLLRVVEILNTPTNEDLHHRLGQQTEYANTLRSRCSKMEQDIRELKTSCEAKDARIAALNREKTQLESNLRAALKQEKVTVGSGLRALERFMQEMPRG